MHNVYGCIFELNKRYVYGCVVLMRRSKCLGYLVKL